MTAKARSSCTALHAARNADCPGLLAHILRELAFVDVQAGRHGPATRALRVN